MQYIKSIKSDAERLSELLSKRKTRRSGKTIVEFAETCPVTAGPKKGQIISLNDAPYARRPLECMGPESIIQLCILMFAAQSMKSVIAQIVTAYYAKEIPSEIIYAMADLAGIRKTMERRLVPMLMHHHIKFITQTETKASRRSGDTTFSKEFPGGNLDGVTANSTAALASETKRIGIADELGQWKVEIGNQGNPFYQLWARLKAWLNEKKCLVPSTPGDEGSCMVEHLFKQGTQEEWFVPCALCGEYQILEVQNKDGFGLDWRTKSGRIIENSIVYVCKKCSRAFKEVKKYSIQQDGEWRQPEGIEPINKYTASFHLHSINSMFESWREIAKAYEAGRDDPIARKNYDNLVAGMPHKQVGLRIDSEQVQKNRGEYPKQTVPDGVLFLTIGADVQRGADRWQEYTEEELQNEIEQSKKDGDIWEKKFPRIELEVFGTGPAYRGWSIDYQVFFGHIRDAFSGAFEQLFYWGVDISEKNGGFGFKREKDGKLFKIVMVLIDSGFEASTVYQFTQRWNYTFPCKGERMITPAKNQKNNHLHNSNFLRWEQSKVGTGINLYSISTKVYKKALYNFLNISRIHDDIQKPGFQDFPREYGTRYFEMLTAEERLINGEYDNKGRPNEATDCRIYNMAASDIYIASQVELIKNSYKKQGKSEKSLEQINSRWFIEYLSKLNKIDPRYMITKTSKKQT